MTIETKFNIGDLVQHKYQRAAIGQQAVGFEVIEIQAINCYAAAQIFYTCRPLHVITEFDWQTKTKSITDVVSGRPKDNEYCKFREDELKVCAEEIVKEILNTKS